MPIRPLTSAACTAPRRPPRARRAKEPLRSVLGHGTERVEAYECADREEPHIEPAQRLDELGLLGQRKCCRLFYCDIRCHASLSTSPRIPVILSNSSCVAINGGEIWTTGSPRS